MNLFTKQSLTDIGKQSHGYQRVTGREDKLGVWDEHTHTALYKTQITRTYCRAQGTILSNL